MNLSDRTLRDDVETVRSRHAPNALVLDADTDFQTLPEPAVDTLATRVDQIEPHEYKTTWLPTDGPKLLNRLVENSAIIGTPGDGAVTWTTTTTPPTVIVKPRVEGSPAGFIAFLVAEAVVAAGAQEPEHFLGLFQDQYRDFADALATDPGTTYQLAASCAAAYRGLAFHPVSVNWDDDLEDLYDAWTTAGEQIAPRVGDLKRSIDAGETGFGDAAELACAAVKHGIEPPAPFGALADERFRTYGADYAVAWANRLGESA